MANWKLWQNTAIALLRRIFYSTASLPPPPATMNSFMPTDVSPRSQAQAQFGQYCLDSLPIGNQFADLGSDFYTSLAATPLPEPYVIATSRDAAELIGLSPQALLDTRMASIFTGNILLNHSKPLAAVYSGHQFGVWAGQLGDGRALLLGDVSTPNGPIELQLKGAGKTPYSRMGDGRAVLRSSVREFLCSEAMAGLGIPTSRALCITGSNYPVFREQAETAAVVTRMAASFVRFGSFEHWFYSDREVQLRQLADYVIANFYPALQDAANPYSALLQEVTHRSAEMIAQWQAVGFMHGVMNTDNMSILGLTIDYGPFGFMERYDPSHICNHSDHQGRYSYRMQPQIGHWNCYALAQALLLLIGSVEEAKQALAIYDVSFANKLSDLLSAKLGLQSRTANDQSLFDDMFAMLERHQLDFTLFFRRLSRFDLNNPAMDAKIAELFIEPEAFAAWAAQYRARLRQENSMDAQRQSQQLACNPKFVLRNYLAQQAIDKAKAHDFSEINTLLKLLAKPFDEHSEFEQYAALPPDWAYQLEVSCSS